MAIVKDNAEMALFREGGRRLARIMREVSEKVSPGVRTDELDAQTKELIQRGGDTPAFLNYTPRGASRPFPAALCVSINNEVVHGIPNENPRVLRPGDVVTLDCGLIHRGYFTDMAVTVPVDTVDVVAAKLIAAAKEALTVAIGAARVGNTTGSIGAVVEAVAKRYGFSVPRELGGHGVGRRVHEEPFIPNFGKPGEGERLVPGMVLAIEPIVCEGAGYVVLADDGYTYTTLDGKRAAQFEHTVLVTHGGPEILTVL